MRCCFLLYLCFAATTTLLASNPKAQKAFKDGLRYEAIAQWKEWWAKNREKAEFAVKAEPTGPCIR